jgi:hypothetical protein
VSARAAGFLGSWPADAGLLSITENARFVNFFAFKSSRSCCKTVLLWKGAKVAAPSDL